MVNVLMAILKVPANPLPEPGAAVSLSIKVHSETPLLYVSTFL